MKGMRFKMAYNVVTLTILFESAPKLFLHFKNGSHVKHQLTESIHFCIKLHPYEYWLQVSCMDLSSQGPSIHRNQ